MKMKSKNLWSENEDEMKAHEHTRQVPPGCPYRRLPILCQQLPETDTTDL
jgi:hypothetical protein